MVDGAQIAGGASALAKTLQAEGIACAPHYVGRPAFELLAFRERVAFGGSGFPWKGPHLPAEHPLEDRADFPATIKGLEQVLVFPWNEGFTAKLGHEIGAVIAQKAGELAV